MRIALLSPFREHSGNNSTARRIEAHLEAAGHKVVQYDPLENPDPTAFRSLCEDLFIQAAIGVHGHKSGKVLMHSSVPYAIVFSNSDLNIDLHDGDRACIMKQAALGARVVVTYNDDFRSRIRALWPDCPKVRCIPKGVSITPQPFDVWSQLRIPLESQIILLPADLRPIKNPLSVIEPFLEVGRDRPEVHLVVLGARRHDEYATWFIERVRSLRRVHYAGVISPGEFHSLLTQVTALLNSSLHEQEPNSILEALAVGCPVVAHRIPGNESIITDGKNGLLYTSPASLIDQLRRLLDDQDLRSSLATEGESFIANHRSLEQEQRHYKELALELAEK